MRTVLPTIVFFGLLCESTFAENSKKPKEDLLVRLSTELKVKDLLGIHRVIRQVKKDDKKHTQVSLMLIQRIRSNSDQDSQIAADALIALGPGTTHDRILAAMLGHRLHLVKAVAVDWLRVKKSVPDAALPPLFQLWQDPRWESRLAALMEIVVARKDAALAIKELIPLIKARDPLNRIRAANVLGRFGKKATSATAALTRARDKEIPVVASMAASALYRITGELEKNQAICRATMASKEPANKYYGLVALVGFKTANLAIFDEIAKVFTHKTRVMRQQAGVVVAQMGKKAIPKIVKLLKDANPHVRASAAFAIGEMHDEGKSATKALMDAYKDDDVKVRAEVISALGGLRTAAKQAEPTLLKALQDADKETRQTAGTAIWLVARRADLAAPILIGFAKDSKNPRSQREYFISMLVDLAPHSKLIGPAMIQMLDDANYGIRAAACVALRRINKPNAKVIAAVKKKLTDKMVDVQREAARTILAFEPP